MIAAIAVISTAPSAQAGAAVAPIVLDIDATDVVHGVQHAHLAVPVRAGALTLAYPKWIPGEHRPNGPITQLMDLKFSANGKSLAWRRDSQDAFAFHLTIPRGVVILDVSLDYASPPESFGSGFGESPNATSNLLVILFNQLTLYPQEAAARSVEVKADVRLPGGWAFDSALSPAIRIGDRIFFPTETLATLVDSPLLAGRYLRTTPVTPARGETRLSLATDAATDGQPNPALIASLRKLVGEATTVFGPGHYRRFVWLVALSDSLDHDGLEHHESADVRESEALFSDPDLAIDWRLFPHEFVHSWNGKYRRPAGLDTRNYQQPMRDDLLWMYEGLTRYYGDFVLTARSGLATQAQTRDYLAFAAAQMAEDRPGRTWRSIADTAVSVPADADAPRAWTAERRGADYYNDMLLVWLEADMIIRQRTHGERSLDDFCKAFFAGPQRAPAVRPYTRADVVDTLRRTTVFDWEAFLEARIDAINSQAPLAGMRAAGWMLSYDDTPNPFMTSLDETSSSHDFSHSLGLWVGNDGVVRDVAPASPTYLAGLSPGMRLVGIDGRDWSVEAARSAVVRAEKTAGPLELVVASGRERRTLIVNYHDGLRYPHLSRVADRPDLLSAVLTARSPGKAP